jgi:hypothetical protein
VGEESSTGGEDGTSSTKEEDGTLEESLSEGAGAYDNCAPQ